MDVHSLKRDFLDATIGGLAAGITGGSFLFGMTQMNQVTDFFTQIATPLNAISPMLGTVATVGIGIVLPLVISDYCVGRPVSWGSAVMRARKNNAPSLDQVFS